MFNDFMCTEESIEDCHEEINPNKNNLREPEDDDFTSMSNECMTIHLGRHPVI